MQVRSALTGMFVRTGNFIVSDALFVCTGCVSQFVFGALSVNSCFGVDDGGLLLQTGIFFGTGNFIVLNTQ